MATPRMRTFISGLVLALLAVGLSVLAPGPAAAESEGRAALPDSFSWSSTGPLIAPRPDADHPIVSVKDPTVFRYKNRWHVYMTTANTAGAWSLSHTSFADWSQAAAAPQTFLDANPNIGNRYAAAPQVFYFAPQKLWYMVYQTGPPSYSTTKDPSKPESWSAPRYFFDAEPPVLTENKGSGFWLDFWTICDKADCYLFFSDDNGHQYRSRTTLAEFPNGFRDTEIVLAEPNRFDLFEASNVYRLGHSGKYLMLVEALATGSDWRRYFRAWTADSLGGTWTPLADTEANAFIRSNNVTFAEGEPAWTKDFSHGEMIRDGVDQTLTIDPCRLRFLYQGLDPAATGSYSQLPWRLSLLTQANSSC
ncbi:non-reducing end alpha-L-arabinofuranosidase family hydrolase [Streptomyces fulvoviolaceus]|uniref:non-reducing end alpha-L-arabinofuranosidase family hydrolase n=1 Tax=Streptomyces fulvoviolaceus TaxID=285535 RepID=UPI0021C1A547|nr:non-reducing end alpha-L-arabinofuranosidase family hydrolase [Streptomyces fulvoviolaceus]MCT9082154.1 non-reducing end alpha-L-arabinofuranosidase family hydrolase [Streptomyces fulvoviolaceus]